MVCRSFRRGRRRSECGGSKRGSVMGLRIAGAMNGSHLPSAAMERKVINPWTWQDAMGFVQANEVSAATRTLIVSGQTSVDSDGAPLHPGNMGAQVEQAVRNLQTVLDAAGFSLSDVVRVTYYTTDVDRFVAEAAGGVGMLLAGGCRPASTLLGISRLFHPDILVEIEATAMK